jgi:hypothetical protein
MPLLTLMCLSGISRVLAQPVESENCGASAVRRWLYLKEIPVSPEADAIVKRMGASEMVSLLEIEEALVKCGVASESVLLSVEELFLLDEPIIAHLATNHYVVLIPNKPTVTVCDEPGNPVLSLSFHDLAKWWKGYAIVPWNPETISPLARLAEKPGMAGLPQLSINRSRISPVGIEKTLGDRGMFAVFSVENDTPNSITIETLHGNSSCQRLPETPCAIPPHSKRLGYIEINNQSGANDLVEVALSADDGSILFMVSSSINEELVDRRPTPPDEYPVSTAGWSPSSTLDAPWLEKAGREQ